MSTGTDTGTMTVTIDASAQKVLQNVRTVVDEARKWTDYDFVHTFDVELRDDDGQPDMDKARAKQKELRHQVVEMELSFYRSFTQLCTGGEQTLGLFWDSDNSLFWRYDNGFHGGLIFHANHHNGQRTPIGTWSLHS